MLHIWISTQVDWPYRFEPYNFKVAPNIFWKTKIFLLETCTPYNGFEVAGRSDYGACLQTWRVELGGN